MSLTALSLLIASTAPAWYETLRSTVFDKSREVAINKGTDLLSTKGSHLIRSVFHLDEKEQIRHIELALKNATERGLANFTTLKDRDQYKDILHSLMQVGAHGEELRKEALKLLAFSDEPDFERLRDLYNRSQRRTALAHNEPYTDVDVAPYLTSFFNALMAELYADPYFKQQLSNTLQVRAATNMQQSLLDVIVLLQQIGEMLENNYTAEQLIQDVEIYTSHIQRTLQRLKIVGAVPKDKVRDPELDSIFVPPRTKLLDQSDKDGQQLTNLVETLERTSCLVLLGGPGSGKSTAIRYLAWSHATEHRITTNEVEQQVTQQPLLSGVPLPMLVELRRLSEARRQENYDILSFLTEVVLKREGIEVNPQMFKELLTRRAMLLLFDGLDEVTTVDERLGLVEEIEHFAQSYPGNRVIVTSRPVGYDLARFSNQLFAHTQILPFNNRQIYQFLQNWYTAVLGLFPIPEPDQQERDRLINLLQNNTRLHMLAENPLLLTVITALHRYERLPDKRVLIYDRCADLLLETWAKIKGTHTRWKGMKMIKEDQYACLAHLGFLLHSQTQEATSEDVPCDITARVMMREIEHFLKDCNLIAEGTELRSEAKSFIELIQVEAGLIVERGTDENGEVLYSFVHRTFQEYFAAAHIYEQFQQLVDMTIVRDFLQEHLHDPHWHEVTLLLLAKFKSRPVSDLLRQLLQGALITKRSQATDVLQQDLFFACACLAEEIVVENDVAQLIIARLAETIKKSGSLLQRKKAMTSLCTLMKTRQYASQSKKTIIDLAITGGLLEFSKRIEVLQILYSTVSDNSKEKQLALSTLTSLLQHSELSFEQTCQAVKVLSSVSQTFSRQQAIGIPMIKKITPYFFSFIANIIDLVEYDDKEPNEPETRQLALDTLASPLQRPELSFEQTCQVAFVLATYSPAGSKEERLAARILISFVQDTKLAGDLRELAYDVLSRMLPQIDQLKISPI